MKKTLFSKSLSFIACIVLIAAMALFTTGCKDTKNDAADKQDTSSAAAVSQTDAGFRRLPRLHCSTSFRNSLRSPLLSLVL